MRREIDGKKFIQGKDLIDIADISLFKVPNSLWDKLFDPTDLSDEYKKYIEITTEEEVNFYNKISECIFLENDLDKMSLDELDNLKEDLKKLKIEYEKDRVGPREQNKRIGIIENKLETIRNYKKLRKPNKYLDMVNSEVRKYFTILSADFPEWLIEYINTNAMQRLKHISQNCGTDYTKIFPVRFHYSTLEHSVAVALIMWNFTHDKKQTLAGLFHDIATPAFRHCIDFMNGDSLTQESTEAYTKKILEESTDIMALLKRDGIKVRGGHRDHKRQRYRQHRKARRHRHLGQRRRDLYL